MSNIQQIDLYKCQINVHLVLIKEQKLLMLKRANTGFQDGMYSLPAGKLEMGETIDKAIIREAREEAGIDIRLGKEWLKNIFILHRYQEEKGTTAIDFFLNTDDFSGTINNMEPHKCEDLSFFNIHNLPKNTIPYIKRAIHNILNGIIFDEFPWQEK